MKAIIITGTGSEHRYVTNLLARALGENLVGVVIEKGPEDGLTAKRLKSYLRRYGFFGMVERTITKFVRKALKHGQQRTAALRSILADDAVSFQFDCDSVTVRSANSKKSLKWLSDRQPDFLFIYGTGIIKKKVLTSPTTESLNLHTGISPYYRGSGTVFWPLYNEEPHMVGATVHECTPDVDGGKIYRRTAVDLDPNDDQYTAFAKCVRDGAAIYAEVAKKLCAGEQLETIPQDLSVGKEYVFRDMTFRHDLKMNSMTKDGRLAKIIESNDKHFTETP